MSDKWSLSILPWKQWPTLDQLRAHLNELPNHVPADERAEIEKLAAATLVLLNRKRESYISRPEFHQVVRHASNTLRHRDDDVAPSQRLLQLFAPEDDAKALLGDLEERWNSERIRLGNLWATTKFYVQLTASVVALIQGRLSKAITRAQATR